MSEWKLSEYEQLHSEIHKSKEIFKSLVEHNRKLRETIRTILEEYESCCLDSEEDRTRLLDHLTDKLYLYDVDKFLGSQPPKQQVESKYIDLFDTSDILED